MSRNKVLVVDDESGVRFGIRDFLEQHGYEIDEAESCQDAQHIFRTSRPDIVIADYMLPDGTALDLLPRLKDIDAGIPLLVLTAHGSIDLAVRAIKEGAEQFLTKPLELPTLLVILQRLLQKQRNHHKQLASKSRQVRQAVDPFIGTSSAVRALADQARKILSTESPVLILGETGTGNKSKMSLALSRQGMAMNVEGRKRDRMQETSQHGVQKKRGPTRSLRTQRMFLAVCSHDGQEVHGAPPYDCIMAPGLVTNTQGKP